MEGDDSQVSADEFEALANALEEDEAETSGDGSGAEAPEPSPDASAPDATQPEHAGAPELAHGHDLTHHHDHGAEILSGDPGFVDPEMSLSTFFNSWDLFGDSAMAGAVAGGLLGFLGVYVVLRRMVFLSAALSQTASLGIVVAFFLQISLGVGFISPLLGALIATFTAIVALTLGVSQDRRDSMLGFVFLLGASGTILLGTRIVQEIQDVQTLLFGTAVAVVPGDFKLLTGIAAVIGALHLAGWRGFVAVVFDSEDARVRGLPTRVIELTLLMTIALAVSVSTRVLGAMPTFAFSVLPGMAALRIARNIQRALWLATILGAIAGFTGYLFAFLFELPVGASQAFVALACIPFAEVVHRIKIALAKST